MMDIAALIQTLSVAALPVIFAITLHEAAHGYVARYCGDTTAWVAGRISLNPLRHIDPFGTLLVPALILMTSYTFTGSGMLFGWAKPVPVNFRRLKNPRRDTMLVSAAGPAMNFLMAIGWTVMLKIAVAIPGDYALPLGKMSVIGIEINLILMVLNLLPLPPLDGGRIAVCLLPYRLAVPFSRIEPYGFWILLFLLFTNILDWIMWPVIALFKQLLLILLQI